MSMVKRLTRDEFLEMKKDFISGLTCVSGCVGNPDDRKKANFNGVYVFLKDDEVFYIGSCYSLTRTIGKDRFREHEFGHHTNSCVLTHLMETYDLTIKQAREMFNSVEFIAFKCDPLEFLLMDNVPGLINSAGYKKRMGV